MTIQDDGKLCFECKKINLLRKAHRIMPSGGALCDEHFREKQDLPQLTIEAKGLILRWKAVTVAEVAPLSTAGNLARKFIDSGMTAKDAREALITQDYTKKEATAALLELGLEAIETSRGTETKIEPQGETTVAKRVDEATRSEMFKDAAAGMSINAIAEKHHSSWPTVKAIVGNGHKAAKNGSAKHTNGRVMMAGKLLDKWNTEANEAFASLPLEKKAELLGTLE